VKHTRDTYLDFGTFCKTVVLEAKTAMDTANVAKDLTKLLSFVAAIAGFSIPILLAISALSGLGALAYFGSMGALIASNPILAGILIGIGGVGLFSIIKLFYKKREVVEVVKEVVISRYRGDFDFAKAKLSASTIDIPLSHQETIDALLKKAVMDLINGLYAHGEITKKDMDQLSSILR
jgi:hypothetical protein